MTALYIDPSEIKLTDYRAVHERLMYGGALPKAVTELLARREKAVSVREDKASDRETILRRESQALAHRERAYDAVKVEFAAREMALARREQEVVTAMAKLRRAEARLGRKLIEEDPCPEADWPPSRRFAFKDIVVAVAGRYGVTRATMFSRGRTRAVVDARRAICVLAREFTLMSLPEIGRMLGGRHHTTVMHHVSMDRPTMAALRHMLGPDAGLDQWVDALHAEMRREPA
ncbi:helix-turn-helix domain-containing protein [Labrys portucalensis]|uniref:Helix-turn-helix domain-containing protein n=1 Tax=Labrys neptuniae TaxID=376174 RepID=A0ABV6Z8M9_9HYPH